MVPGLLLPVLTRSIGLDGDNNLDAFRKRLVFLDCQLTGCFVSGTLQSTESIFLPVNLPFQKNQSAGLPAVHQLQFLKCRVLDQWTRSIDAGTPPDP